jgi:hypothetical protein
MSLLSTAGSWINRVGGASPLGRWIGLRPKAPVSREDALDLRPVRNPVVKWEPIPGPSLDETEGEDGPHPGPLLGNEREEEGPRKLMLVVPRKEDRLTNFLARMLQAPEEKRIELDEFGSAIWERCDGTRTVEDLARFTSTTYKLNRRQAEVSVMAFMKMLSQRRLIGFMKDGRGSSDVGPSTRQRAAKRRGGGERKRRF